MRIALPAAIDPAAFVGLDPAAAVTDLAGETMGTRWNVRCVLPAAHESAANVSCQPDVRAELVEARVRAAIVARLDGLVAEMSHWLPTSTLCRFNRSEAGRRTALPPDFAHVMRTGLAIAAATDGAFDPTIGRLVDLRGFGPVAGDTPPTPEAIATVLADSGWRRIAFEDGMLRQPGGLALDLSGIAKGHAVDAVADVLGALGIRHALVEIGGELVGRGVRPDGRPWWVDLEVPPGTDIAPLRVALHGLAVATSGDYVRGGHTLDPRTGAPATSGVVSASVVHASAMVADAWATALTIAGPVEGTALAAAHGIAGRIVTAAGEHLSPALAAMLDDGPPS